MIYDLTGSKLQIVFGIFFSYGDLDKLFISLKMNQVIKIKCAYSYNSRHIYTKCCHHRKRLKVKILFFKSLYSYQRIRGIIKNYRFPGF